MLSPQAEQNVLSIPALGRTCTLTAPLATPLMPSLKSRCRQASLAGHLLALAVTMSMAEGPELATSFCVDNPSAQLT